MSRKSTKLQPFQKLLTVMVSGKPVTIDEIDATLGKEIYMYRLSTYIWHIKTFANGVVKPTKDGRKVTAYQIVNVDEIKEYMKRVGIDSANFTAGSKVKKPSQSKLAKLSDLDAQPLAPIVEETVVDVKVEEVQLGVEVDLVVEEITNQ
jgi:NADH/NAD ratio-sensing transcriptional regulator Rex